MDRIAWQALGDLLGRDDLRLDAALGDLGRQPLGRRARRIEPDKLPTRRAQRGGDRMEAVQARDVAAAARLVPAEPSPDAAPPWRAQISAGDPWRTRT